MAKDPRLEPTLAHASAFDEEAEPLGPPRSYRLQIVVGFASLFLFQLFIFWMLLPPRTVVQTNVGINPVEGVSGYETPNVTPPDIGSKKKTQEKTINDGKPIRVNNLRDDDINETFTIKIDVLVNQADGYKFDTQYKARTAQIMERITTILKATTTVERQEAGSTAIKEKLKIGINEVLGTPLVQQVFCTQPDLQRQ